MILALLALLAGALPALATTYSDPTLDSPHHADRPAHPLPSPPPLLPPSHLHSRSPTPLHNLTFNYTLSDADPLLTYTPSSSGPSALTWQHSFSLSPAPSLGSSIFGRGESAHTTSMPGSTVGWTFYGTGVYVLGTASEDARVRLTTDGANADFVPSVHNLTDRDGRTEIAWAEAEEGWHDVVLSVLGGTVGVGGVKVRTVMRTQA